MFLFEIATLPYRDPWDIPFTKRFSLLGKGSRSVAYFYDRPDNSTFRYRVYNMLQALEASQYEISGSFFTGEELDHAREIVDKADTIVICRFKYCPEINSLITLARNKGKPVFFDVDDLVFDVDYVHLVMNTLDQDVTHPNGLDWWFAYFGRIGATLSLCDSVITTNSFLAEQIYRFSGKDVHVVPNFLNREQIQISEQIYLSKKEGNFRRDDTIHLGYFSGTPTHSRDFDIVLDTLVHLLEEDPKVRLVIVGFLDLKPELARFSTRIENSALTDFIGLQRLIGRVEINLVPLQDNIFTNCKSNLKYFEAAAVGTVTIASPTFTYRNAIVDGKNGYLAPSYSWFDKILTALGGMDDYPLLAEKAYEDAMQRHSWQAQVPLLEKTLFG